MGRVGEVRIVQSALKGVGLVKPIYSTINIKAVYGRGEGLVVSGCCNPC